MKWRANSSRIRVPSGDPMKVLSSALLLAYGALAFAQAPKAIITSLAGNPLNVVPGSPTETWSIAPGRAFEELAMSPDGTKWALSARVEAGTTDLISVLYGSGTTVTGLIARRGSAAPWGQNFENISTTGGISINNDGLIAIGGDDANANNTQDGYLATFDGSSVTRIRQESETAVGAVPPGSFYWGSFNSLNLDSSGKAAFFATTGVTSGAGRRTFYIDNTLLFRAQDTSINNLGGTPTVLTTMSDGSLRTNSSASSHLYVGTLSSPASTLCVVKDGQVVIQRNLVLPGSSFTEVVNNLYTGTTYMSTSGNHWGIVASNTGGLVDYVVKNGAVIAKKGDPIVTGSSFNWDDVSYSQGFFNVATNNFGETVIGGLTTDPDLEKNAKLVFLDKVILSEGDPMDVTGDGVVDPGFFLDAWNDMNNFLSDGNTYTFTAWIQDAAGVRVGQGMFTMELPIPGDINGDGEVGAADFSILASAYDSVDGDPNWNAAADINGDGEVGAADFSILAANYDRTR